MYTLHMIRSDEYIYKSIEMLRVIRVEGFLFFCSILLMVVQRQNSFKIRMCIDDKIILMSDGSIINILFLSLFHSTFKSTG